MPVGVLAELMGYVDGSGQACSRCRTAARKKTSSRAPIRSRLIGCPPTTSRTHCWRDGEKKRDRGGGREEEQCYRSTIGEHRTTALPCTQNEGSPLFTPYMHNNDSVRVSSAVVTTAVLLHCCCILRHPDHIFLQAWRWSIRRGGEASRRRPHCERRARPSDTLRPAVRTSSRVGHAVSSCARAAQTAAPRRQPV
jgi:hypothetical protein